MQSIRKILYEECLSFPAPYVLDNSSIHDTPGTVSFEDFESLYRIQIIDAPIIDISSTRIREAEARGEDMSEWRM